MVRSNLEASSETSKLLGQSRTEGCEKTKSEDSASAPRVPVQTIHKRKEELDSSLCNIRFPKLVQNNYSSPHQYCKVTRCYDVRHRRVF